MRWLTTLLFLFLAICATAQDKQASITGAVVDEDNKAIPGVNIIILGKINGVTSNDSGMFTITVPANKAFALTFTYTGFKALQKNFFLSAGETEIIAVTLFKNGTTLDTVIIRDERERQEAGLVKINPKNALTLPSTTGGIEGLIKTLVGSNNELTSQYSVRGGSYDENLIYINDFEVFRPYLVSSGQQEGLSFINPALTKNVNFYTGGFQSKYGDKMSSVLDIQYTKPTQIAGSAYVSLLEQGLHLEGSKRNGSVTYIAGVRNKSNRNLLSSQPTLGNYLPSASDAQAYITWKLSTKWQLELLGIYATSRFSFMPESVKKTSAVFSPLFSASLGLDVSFDGQEKDSYTSTLVGATIVNNTSKNVKLKWLLNRFTDSENENFDITGAYLFGDRDFDNSSGTFGEIINPLGAGITQNYGRNKLNITVLNASHKGSFAKGNNFLQWGTTIEQTNITDQLKQFEYRDSAGYSLPNNAPNLLLFAAQNNSADLSIQKYSGYLQNNIHLLKGTNDITIQAGIRVNYNSLNKQLLVSPRAQISWKPGLKKDLVFKLAAGVYSQPPFYRELRKYNGDLNTDVLAQKSVQIVAGADYNFKTAGSKPFRLTTEVYYKTISALNPYDIDNVKIKYFGNNNAKGYTTGAEFRLFGQLVTDAESWLSVAFMRSRENLNDDFYFQYKNAAGEIIDANTTDQLVTDSVRTDVGFVRRPTDRLITVGLFLEDYLATNKNFKAHLNLLYGSNMSYNIPNSTRFRNGLIIDPYIRADVGFSALLLGEQTIRRSHSPFKGVKNIWLSVEVFNIIDRANTISYQLIKDFSNATYAIPNRLTPRLLNAKLLVRF